MAAGDTDATAAFVRRYQARVYGLAYSIIGSSAIAEEVAQEAFLRAWRHAAAYDPRRSRASTWLLTITRNLAIDAIRLRHELPMDPHLLVASLTARDTESPGIGFEDADLLRAALRELPIEQSTSVVLAVFYGMTAKEVAEREQIPLGTAKTRIRRGLARLRDVLGVSDG
jgi:RNA polymerase sigma-70 factor (ECF subfamily)